MGKSNLMKGAVGTMMGVALGGAAIKMVGDSNMPSGIKEATQIGIGAGILGHSMKSFGGKKKLF